MNRTNTVFAIKRAKTVHNRAAIDPELLVVEHNAQPPKTRSVVGGKYEPVFGKLKPGSSIRCEPSERGAITQALAKKVSQGVYPALKGCVVRSYQRCEDGHARVFVLKP